MKYKMNRFQNFSKNSKEMQLFSLEIVNFAMFLDIIVGLVKYTLTAPKLALLGSQISVFD